MYLLETATSEKVRDKKESTLSRRRPLAFYPHTFPHLGFLSFHSFLISQTEVDIKCRAWKWSVWLFYFLLHFTRAIIITERYANRSESRRSHLNYAGVARWEEESGESLLCPRFDSIPTGFLILQCQLGGSWYFTLVLKVGRFPLRQRMAATPGAPFLSSHSLLHRLSSVSDAPAIHSYTLITISAECPFSVLVAFHIWP